MEAMHPYIERSGLVRVIACAPVARIATSRVSLPRRFYSSSLYYCQTPSRTAQSSTLNRRGHLIVTLDLTRNLNTIPCPYPSTHNVLLSLCAAIATSAAPTRSRPRFSAPKGQRHCTLRGVRRVGTLERASRQSRKSTDRPSGSRTRRLDPSAGLEHGRCARLPEVWHIVPKIDQTFDIEGKTLISVYPDIAPISCTTSKFLPLISAYPDIAARYRMYKEGRI